MDESRQTGSGTALEAGRLEGISFPDLLWTLCHDKKRTGVLCLTSGDLRKTVFIADGQIVFASSSDPDDRLGELLLRLGMVTLDQLEKALAKLHTGKRLGTLLVEAESLTTDQLVQAVLTQVESIVLDLFTWEKGEYRFDDGPLPSDEVITLGMKTGEILLRGIRRIRSFNRIRRSVGPAHLTYGVSSDWQEPLEGFSLNEGEELLIERLRDGDDTVENLCREVFLSNFEIYQTLWGLKVVGAIEEREAVANEGENAVREGELRQTGFDELLVQLGRERATGVLHVSRQAMERTFHIKEGRCVFATSSDPEDGLVAFLLRRGVISLRDREETERRLLSNKRVGTILWELGVIDDRDLREMVRQQIGEIVYDTFNWDDAHFAFLAGPLPSNEQITLEESLHRLVASGIRRVTAWNHVLRGCGGLDTPLGLHPSFMEVLDAMDAGQEEWQVLAATKPVRTPRQICRHTDLGDFRTCQILWSLRVLGALEMRPRVETEMRSPAVEESPGPDDVAEENSISPANAGVPLAADETDPSDQTVDSEVRLVQIEDDESGGEAQPEDIPVQEIEACDSLESSTPIVDDEPQVVKIESADWDQEASEIQVDGVDDREPEPCRDEEAFVAAESTQVVPRDVVDNALHQGEASVDGGVDEPSPGETQIIASEVVEASLRGEVGGGPDDMPDLERVEHSADETQLISRDVIDRTLTGEEPRDDLAEIGQPEFEPHVELDSMIARFNAMQRLVYRIVRAEVGAGAVNFVRTCCLQLATELSGPLQDAELKADGSWDTQALRQAVVEQRISDPWPDYQRLIEIEIDVLREHIGEGRAENLQRQVAGLEAPGATAG